MKDIPVFTTEFGVASLILKEIPYRQEAYIRIQTTQQPQELLKECISFCRMCGAEKNYATGHSTLEGYPLHTAVVMMCAQRDSLPQTDAALFPVIPENLEQWRSIYNARMAQVPNASWMTQRDAQELLQTKDAYFVHRGGELLGIGRAAGDTIHVVAAVKPGSGRDVIAALGALITEDTVRLTVAEANIRAVKLYEKTGFLKTRELSRWYQII